MGKIGHEMQSHEVQRRNEIKNQRCGLWLRTFAAAQRQ